MRSTDTPDVDVQQAAVLVAQLGFAGRMRRHSVADPLTGHPVRSMLVERLELFLAQAGPGVGHLAVLCCDLDGLAGLGAAAEAVRTQAVGRLVGAVRQGDVVARAGERTVVLLCPGIQREDDAETIADRVIEAFDAPLLTDVGPVHLRLGVGVALSGRLSTTETLLTTAYTAMSAQRRDDD